MPNHRPYGQIYDIYGNTPIQTQLDNPATLEFIPQFSSNPRQVLGSDSNPYKVADATVSIRGSKQVLWSTEAFTTSTGIQYPALTTNQKKATGTSAINLASPAFLGAALPAGFTAPPTTIDFSPFKSLLLLINVASITGTSMTFELDFLDDTATPVAFAFKTTAVTAAAQIIMNVGRGATTQAASPPTSYGAVTDASGTLIYPLAIDPAPQGQIAWTASSITAFSWTGWLYGIA